MLSRREIILALGALPAVSGINGAAYADAVKRLPRRLLGRTGREIVPLALGGIGSIQHHGAGLDAPDIVVAASNWVSITLILPTCTAPASANSAKHSAGSTSSPKTLRTT
jgi:hypothetical protein